jgi:hypothetical protein
MSCDLHRTCHLLNNGSNPSCYQRGPVHCDLLRTGHLHSLGAMWVAPNEHGACGRIRSNYKCVVHFVPIYKQLPSRTEHLGFIVQKVYNVKRKLWELTDNDYE